MLTVIYDDSFNAASAADDIGLPGRMEAAMSGFWNGDAEVPVEIVRPHPASPDRLLLAHGKEYVDLVAENAPLFAIASLAAGSAVLAADLAFHGEPSFACITPPGHHASRDNAWGHCTFNNIAIALLTLRGEKRIESGFVIDIEAHTGDGTRNILSAWKEADVFNPFAENAEEYIDLVGKRLDALERADIIAVSAGFDAYIEDVGHKLATQDFEILGSLIAAAAKRVCGGRRFAVLEGGYYLKDLGLNIQAFCRGFSS